MVAPSWGGAGGGADGAGNIVESSDVHEPKRRAVVQGDPRIVELLNQHLTLELTAINQYFLNARMCENWGYARLAKRHREIALQEMTDTEELIDRILYLEGHPNLQRLGTVRVGETPVEQIQLAAELERTALRDLSRYVVTCVEVGDQATREFLARMIAEEEAHLDHWETQLATVEQVGEANYLSQQIRD
jgi:bacterioferritin